MLLPQLAGRRRAARYLLLGEPFGAAEALEIGLVSHLASEGRREAVTDELVAALLAKPAEALRQTQKLLSHNSRDEILQRMELESRAFAERLESEELKQAIAAFFAARARA